MNLAPHKGADIDQVADTENGRLNLTDTLLLLKQEPVLLQKRPGQTRSTKDMRNLKKPKLRKVLLHTIFFSAKSWMSPMEKMKMEMMTWQMPLAKPYLNSQPGERHAQT